MTDHLYLDHCVKLTETAGTSRVRMMMIDSVRYCIWEMQGFIVGALVGMAGKGEGESAGAGSGSVILL